MVPLSYHTQQLQDFVSFSSEQTCDLSKTLLNLTTSGFTYRHLRFYLPSSQILPTVVSNLPTIVSRFTNCRLGFTYHCLGLPTINSGFTYSCFEFYMLRCINSMWDHETERGLARQPLGLTKLFQNKCEQKWDHESE